MNHTIKNWMQFTQMTKKNYLIINTDNYNNPLNGLVFKRSGNITRNKVVYRKFLLQSNISTLIVIVDKNFMGIQKEFFKSPELIKTYVKIGVKNFNGYSKMYLLLSDLKTFKELNPSMRIMFESRFEKEVSIMIQSPNYWFPKN